jgi:hypothetical protein
LNLGNNLKMDFDNCIEPNVMFIHSHPLTYTLAVV